MNNRHIKRVSEAREQREQARLDLIEAIAEAIEAGAPQTLLAPVAGISRRTLQRWLDERGARSADTPGPMTAPEDTSAAAAP